jgi:hypothetical protein
LIFGEHARGHAHDQEGSGGEADEGVEAFECTDMFGLTVRRSCRSSWRYTRH